LTLAARLKHCMLSVVILTKNEEKLIGACLESVKWADEIIVIDSGSTDRTLEIVKKFTAKIFNFSGDDFSQRRNLGMEKAHGEWVLYIDADERVLQPLKDEIQKLIVTTDKSAFALSRQNIIFGQEVNYGPYQHDWMIRLFKKDKFETWVGKVHEYGKFKGELGYTQQSLLHLTHRDLDHVMQKSLDWSRIDAKLRLDASHPKMKSWRFFRIFFSELFHQGVTRKGFLGGEVGVIDSFLQTISLFLTYVRLWQLQQPKPLAKVYEDIDKKLLDSNFKNYK
jgi:hypothetical protein